MAQDREKLGSDKRQVRLPAGILDRIMKRICEENNLQRIRRLILITGFFLFCSVLVLLPALISVWIDLANSGFFYFLTLIFFDLRMIIANWQNFFYSLLELIPATELILSLVSILFCLIAMKLLLKYTKTFIKIKQLILELKR